MLTKKSKYAIKALVALAREYDQDSPMRIATISETEHIPRKFLEAILLELKNQGILGSRLGVNGGYYLMKSPAKIMLSSVIRITDGPIALIPCVSLNFYERCEECDNESTCSIRDVAIEVRNASLRVLNGTSLADMVKREKQLTKQKTTKKKT
jgi:Rrf2 family protein